MVPALPGPPTEPFSLRFNRLCSNMFGTRADYMMLAIIVSIWVRLAPKLHLVTHAWLTVQTLLALGSLGWRRYRPASFARLREVQAAVFRLNGAGFGAALLMLRSLIDEIEPSVPGGADGGAKAAARHAVLLLQAGSVVPMVLWWVTPLRFWLALPIQVAAVLNAASWNPYVCQGRALADAAAQQRTHAAYSLIGAARFALLPGPAAPLAPAQECAVVLSFLQLAITVAAPALAQAALEAALFAQHVAQRRAAGLPPGGTRCEGRLYSLVREAAEACDGPAALVAAWILLGILWELAVALVVGRQ